jgi:hypothetical protein
MLTLALACLLLDLPSQSSSLLSAVPDDATAVAVCSDVGLLHDRIANNRWAQFLQTSTGKGLLIDSLLEGVGTSEFDKMAEIGSELRGESVFFSRGTMTGFLTIPPTSPGTLKAAMQNWMPDKAQGYNHASQVMFGAQVDILARDRSELYQGVLARSAPAVALVHHPKAFGLFTADNGEDLLSGLKSSLSGLGSAHHSPLVEALMAHRSEVGHAGLVELIVDSSEAINEMVDDFSPPGVKLTRELVLGEGSSHLYLSLDAQPGTRLEMRGLFSVPAGTLASRFADCLRPLPTGLADSIPHDSIALTSIGLDIAKGYDLGRTLLEELNAEEAMNTVEQGLAAGEAMTGVDLEQAMIRQLIGPFTAVLLDTHEGAASGELFDLPAFFSYGLRSGAQFQEALEELMPLGEQFIQLELTDVEGVDVYQTEGFEMGLAFLPQAFILGMNESTLTNAISLAIGKIPVTGEPGRVSDTLMANPGVCALATTVMSPFWHSMMELDDKALELMEGAQLTSTMRRVTAGFELRLIAH